MVTSPRVNGARRPAAAMSLGALLNESDFAVVALDDLQANLLSADRDNAGVRDYYEMVHPAVFETLARMSKDAARKGKQVVLFGETAAEPERVPFYIGVGYRSFSVAPARSRGSRGRRATSRWSAPKARSFPACRPAPGSGSPSRAA